MEANREKLVEISVIIHTKNEEECIERCLKSVMWADEIVLMDMNSSDRTVEIAGRYTANIHSCPDFSYVEPARNLAIGKARKDWILLVDADEEIPENLAAGIQKIISAADGYALIALPRRNYIGDYQIRDSGWGADYQPRLFKRGKVKWQDTVHSWPQVDGEIKYLDPAEGYYIKHHNFADLADFVERTNQYTKFEAEKILGSGRKFAWKDMVQETLTELNRRYTPKADGMHSLLLAGCMAFYKFLSYGKALEKQYNENKNFQFEVPDDLMEALKEGAAESAAQQRHKTGEVVEWARGLERELALERERLVELQATLLAVKKSPQFRFGFALGKTASSLKRPFETLYRLFAKPHRLAIKGGMGISFGAGNVGFIEGTFRPRRDEYLPKMALRAGGRNWDCTVEPAHPSEKMQILNEYRFSCAFVAREGFQIIRLLQLRPQVRTKQVIASSILWRNHPQSLAKNFRIQDEHRLIFPKMDSPLVSIVIPVHDQLAHTLRCLAGILTATTGVNYEVIVGNDNPDKKFTGILDSIEGIRVASTGGNAGFTANCNQAAKLARGKFLLFLSCDAQVTREWLSSLIFVFKRTPSANAIVWKGFSAVTPLAGANHRADDSLIIDRELFEKLDGFDEKYEPDNFEITDFAFHAWSKGGRAYFVEGKPASWTPRAFTPPREHGLSFPTIEKPLVSIVVPVHNQLGYTLRCLRSILAHTPDIAYEVIIGDDNSDKAFMDVLASMPGLRLTTNTGAAGFVANCNQAARLARGKYLLFLNNDTEARPGWLSSLIDIFNRFPDAGAVGSKLIYPDGRLQEAGGIIWSDATGCNYGKNDDAGKPEYNYVRETDYCSAASLLVDRELFARLGGFSKEFEPAYYEDVDLAFKIRAAGRKVYYQPASTVVHYEGRSCGTDTGSGMKAAQVVNHGTFRSKWAAELASHGASDAGVLRARERSKPKKLAVFIDHYVPMIDQDAGSRSTFHYVKLFVDMGMSVKFVGDNFYPHKPYTGMLEQIGVEVLYGDWYRNNIHKWLLDNADEIDVIFAIRSQVTIKYLETFRQMKHTRVLYYGIDIASIRLQREAELTNSQQARDEAVLEEKLEMTIWKSVDAIYYPSTEEAVYVSSKLPDAVSRAIPLNICEPFDEDYPGTLDQRKDLMFVGGFQHPPNADGILWFLDECWPCISKDLPGCKFYIVGSNPPEAIRQRLSDRVVITGWLSDNDLTALYQRARLIVAPLRYGGGVKGKVVEAVRHHIPPVITPMAAEGLPGIERCTCIREATPGVFAKAVVTLYQDENALRNLSAQCSPYVNENFSFATALKIIAQDIPDWKTPA